MFLSPVAGAVIVRSGRLLLMRRASPVGALLWTFPSGKVEPGESASEAAVREAGEEVGVSVAPMVVLGSRVHPLSGRRVVYVACRLVGGEAHAASAREVAEVAWVDGGRLAELVPGGLYGPVQAWVNGRLAGASAPASVYRGAAVAVH
ncbi:8-oxo-dGTP diphosphatase [Streptomyces sp. SAI-135]|uniref:NUDIX hydrolase n=1 Tax=unclassified Streptomyces TaxID=2593676 RepID=UPI0024759498|nr:MULTISPECIES: NUDIX domain-containing protein [unclassified Streptomyces]MDH6513908.1 8-oxo-dGTP diphosphatase [Streptomyces sp. SAI-090]MDH6622011.1 8-oxo-dGTP diphosphatase [Streptomyces sp. SAI-135]